MRASMADDAVHELDHTADIGFEVEASSLDGLFRLAARGLVSALGVDPAADADEPEAEAGAPGAEAAGADEPAPDGAPPSEPPEELTLERPDLERLLVAWLRELLHRSTAERLLPEVERVRVREPEGGHPPSLAARIAWRPCSDDPVREIKGVTYHGLRVRKREDAWHARVVLDV